MCNLPKEAVSQLKRLGFLRLLLFNSAFRIMNKALDHTGDSGVAAPRSKAPPCTHLGRTPPRTRAVPQAGWDIAVTGGQGTTEKVTPVTKSKPGTKFSDSAGSRCGFVPEGIGGETVMSPDCPELSEPSVVAAPGSPACGTPPCAHAVPQAGRENAVTGGQGVTERVASAKAKSEPGTKFSDSTGSRCGFVPEGIGGESVMPPECPELSDRYVVAAPGSPACGTPPPRAHAVSQAGQEIAVTGGQGATERVTSANAKNEPGTKFSDSAGSRCGFVPEGIGGETVMPPDCPELSEPSVVAAPGSPLCGTPPCTRAVPQAGREIAATGGQGVTERVTSAKAKSEPGTKFSDSAGPRCGFVPEDAEGESVMPPECPGLSDRAGPACGTAPLTLSTDDEDPGKPPASSNQRHRPGDIPPESPESGVNSFRKVLGEKC